MNAFRRPEPDTCWGVSMRDVERNGTRNSDHTDFIFDSIKGISNLNFMYQYCGHETHMGKNDTTGKCIIVNNGGGKPHDAKYACKTIEAIIFSSVVELDNKTLKRLVYLGKLFDVPVVVVYHEDYDYDYNHVIAYRVKHPNKEWEDHEDAQWRNGFLSELKSLHRRHMNLQHECKPKTDEWLDGGTEAELVTDGSLPRLRNSDDLTVSGALRVIPGVRHLDMDVAVFCDECDELICLIEASADQFSRGDEKYKKKVKGISMTLALANKARVPAIRLLHEVPSKAGLVTEETKADVSIWDSGKSWESDARNINAGLATMNDLINVIDVAVAKHDEKEH